MPVTLLQCAGQAVGLPEDVVGNSEVGHLNSGAGCIVYQDLLKIDRAIQSGAFHRNAVFCSLMDAVIAHGSALYLIGLVSDGGVHSDLGHLLALLHLAKARGLQHVFVHAITDGRDTPPDSGLQFVAQLAVTLNGGSAKPTGTKAAAHRRDGKIRPCHLFFQRRRGETVRQRKPLPDSFSPRCGDL